jgi:hypothetical protein
MNSQNISRNATLSSADFGRLGIIAFKFLVNRNGLDVFLRWYKAERLQCGMDLSVKVMECVQFLLYRGLRKKRLTIRKSNDCLIAFYAIEFSMPLVHLGTDFELISKHSKLKTWNSKSG